MNNTTQNNLMLATGLMIAAQIIFAFVNFSYDVISNPWNPLLPDGKLSTSAAVFWQYFVAAIFAVPLMMRIGFSHLKTDNFWLHELRALTSAIGVQVFVFGFASGVPPWQMVGLLLTGPFWVMLGSVLFLGEMLTTPRILATIAAFIGAFLINGAGEGGFSAASLLPVLAAMLWSATTVISKYLAREESAEALTLWLLILIVANHVIIGLVLALLAGAMPGLVPEVLASGVDISFPGGSTLIWVLGLGLITAVTQYLLWSAYSRADASYLQPFDAITAVVTVLFFWVAFSQVPSTLFWPGAILIVGASLYITRKEAKL